MKVELSKSAKKALEKIPKQLVIKFGLWVSQVETQGIREAQKSPFWKDHPIPSKGTRAIRLNLQWRAEYLIKGNSLEIVFVTEVHPHDY